MTTLITGASSGIGEAFARKLAAQGHDLLLVARAEDKLIALCNELGLNHDVRAQYLAIDLTEADAAARLLAETRERYLEIDFLINNAGFGSLGEFAKLDLPRELNMIDLNVRSLVELTYLFLEPMRERGAGSIINVASTAGFQPVPFMATYGATKAFVLSFSEALAEENRPYGVKVLALCPGVTMTGFFAASRMRRPPGRASQTPEQVVEVALRALKRGKSSVISGWTNLFMMESQRVLPRSFVLKTMGSIMRSHSEKG
ncbi:MAG TPA: SDR family oxidoreductase [Pyrinomonadaceae bacterium]|nr:SDR family oxidoreductase [Pyrinomonadaceae bacterium]